MAPVNLPPTKKDMDFLLEKADIVCNRQGDVVYKSLLSDEKTKSVLEQFRPKKEEEERYPNPRLQTA